MPIVFNNPQNTNDGILDAFRAGKSDVRAQAALDQEIAQGKQQMALAQQRMALEQQQAQRNATLFGWQEQDRIGQQNALEAMAQQTLGQTPSTQSVPGGAALKAAGAAFGGPLGSVMQGAGNALSQPDIELEALKQQLARKDMSAQGKLALAQDFHADRQDKVVRAGYQRVASNLGNAIVGLKRTPGAEPYAQELDVLQETLKSLEDPSLTPAARAQIIDHVQQSLDSKMEIIHQAVQRETDDANAIAAFDEMIGRYPVNHPLRRRAEAAKIAALMSPGSASKMLQSFQFQDAGAVPSADGSMWFPDAQSRAAWESSERQKLVNMALHIQENAGKDPLGTPSMTFDQAMSKAREYTMSPQELQAAQEAIMSQIGAALQAQGGSQGGPPATEKPASPSKPAPEPMPDFNTWLSKKYPGKTIEDFTDKGKREMQAEYDRLAKKNAPPPTFDEWIKTQPAGRSVESLRLEYNDKFKVR